MVSNVFPPLNTLKTVHISCDNRQTFYHLLASHERLYHDILISLHQPLIAIILQSLLVLENNTVSIICIVSGYLNGYDTNESADSQINLLVDSSCLCLFFIITITAFNLHLFFSSLFT